MGFPTRNDHFGVFWGYHHLRKPPHRFTTKNGPSVQPKSPKRERSQYPTKPGKGKSSTQKCFERRVICDRCQDGNLKKLILISTSSESHFLPMLQQKNLPTNTLLPGFRLLLGRGGAPQRQVHKVNSNRLDMVTPGLHLH